VTSGHDGGALRRLTAGLSQLLLLWGQVYGMGFPGFCAAAHKATVF